jgi:hypothetical protein
MVGMRSTITNEANSYLNEATGIHIKINDEGLALLKAVGLRVESLPGSAGEAYAIYTDEGPVHLGDYLEVVVPASVPGQPATNNVRIYPKSDGKLYAKDWQNNEYDLTGEGGGSGTVTSVGLALPNDVFDVSGSPVTDAGTLTAAFDDQNANNVFAGPASGAAGTPAFRSLVADDIPSLTAAKVSDFDTEVSNNTDVSANTTHRQTTSGNPHNVSASDVGNTTAQWNANKLQGRTVANTAPTEGQALVWDNANSQWVPGDVEGSVAFSGARVYRTTDQWITSSTLTDISFDAERFDTDDYHDNSTNNNRLTVPTAGKYLLIANISWQPYSGGDRQLGIRLNGTTLIACVRSGAAPAGQTRQSVSTVWDASAYDYFTCEVLHTAPGSGTSKANASFSPEFMIVKLA